MKFLTTVAIALFAVITPAAFAQSDMQIPKKDQMMDALTSKTKAEARADTLAFLAMGGAAQQNGEYRLVSALPTTQLSREQVGAECAEAVRLGLLKDGHTTIIATPAQIESIRAAGMRAKDKAMMAK